ncbi:iron-sulfur cluster assembly scaffold protein [Patescibacteria group bacterium]
MIKDGLDWQYSETVKKHFFNPQNVLLVDPKSGEFDAEGEVGSPACGDVMKMWIKFEGDKIKDFKWRTFGCASAIASTSVFSEMVIGKSIDEALKITPKDIMNELGGLPEIKIHCSVLADQAFKETIKNYQKKSHNKNTQK